MVVYHHEQIDEHRGEQQADGEIVKGAVHAGDLATDIDLISHFQMRAFVGDNPVNGGRRTTEIAVLHAGIDVIHGLDVALVVVGLHLAAFRGGDIAQQIGDLLGGTCAGRCRAGDRDVVQVILVVQAIFGGLHGHVVGNAVFRVGPEIRRHLLGRTQVDVDVGGYLVDVQAKFLSARAVYRVVQFRRVQLLLHVGIHHTGHGGDALGDAARDVLIVDTVPALHLHVDLRWHAEIQDLRHQIGGLEIELNLGKGRRQFVA